MSTFPLPTGNRGVVVLGLQDVRRKMMSLPRRIGINVVRRGLLAGAGVIRDEARLRAPQPPGRARPTKDGRTYPRTGLLVSSITSETRGMFRNSSGQPVAHFATVRIRRPRGSKDAGKGKGRARLYAPSVEKGAAPHAIGKGSIRVRFERSRRQVNQTGGMHPGIDPQPFMGPAFHARKYLAVEVMKARIRRDLDIELRNIAAGRGSAA